MQTAQKRRGDYVGLRLREGHTRYTHKCPKCGHTDALRIAVVRGTVIIRSKEPK